jgi:hypothetical protein
MIDLPVLDLQPARIPVAAQIGQAEWIPLVAGHHAERSKLLAPVINWMGKRQERAVWAAMKRYLEAPQPKR